MILHQSPTFRPLMGQFVPFAQIASRAGQYDIAGIIRTATRYGYYMINMIFIQLFSAPIAFAFLSMMLLMNIFRSITSVSGILESTAAVPIDPGLLSCFLTMSSSPFPTIGSSSPWVNFSIELHLGIYSFFVLGSVLSLILSMVISILQTPLLHIGSIPLGIAWFTSSSQFARTRCYLKEMISSCRKLLLTGGATFKWGGIIHCLTPLWLVPWVVLLPGKQGTSFSQRFMTPLLGNAFDYIFFSTARKAEGVIS